MKRLNVKNPAPPRHAKAVALAMLWACALPVQASSPWRTTTTLQGVDLQYSNSSARARLNGWGLFVAVDYFEDYSFTGAYNQRVVRFKSELETSESDVYVSGRANRFFDKAGGRGTIRVDAHRLKDSTAGIDDEIQVWAMQLAYLGANKKLYADVGYTESSYASENAVIDDIKIVQWTPTLAFALGARDWLQMRGYVISHSHSNRLMHMRVTKAAELKWTHRFDMHEGSGPESLILGALNGERMYAVDPDSADVYALSDAQRAVYTLGLRWRITQSANVLALVGQQEYRAVMTDARYFGTHIYLSINTMW